MEIESEPLFSALNHFCLTRAGKRLFTAPQLQKLCVYGTSRNIQFTRKNMWYNSSPIQRPQILLVALIQSICSCKRSAPITRASLHHEITSTAHVEILIILSSSSFLLYVLV